MRSQERAMARKKLDKRLNILQNTDNLARPSRGWIKAIREALGMTTTQLAKRLGVSQPRVTVIEKAESAGVIKLETLERAAQALDCRLVYALVPRNSLESTVEERASSLARKRLRATSHSMALEDQRVEKADEREHLERLVKNLLDQSGSALWEDE
ncbi:MAG: putative DNA-binding mobile mystery protein A [Lysobacterales bacterium]|jgi:predicted DNA-binding mobile mystery protein A